MFPFLHTLSCFESLYQLNVADKLLIAGIEKKSIDFDHKIKEISSDHIFKFSVASDVFLKKCTEEKYNSLWQKKYTILYYVVSLAYGQGVLPFNHVGINYFNLFLGMNLFYHAMLEQKKATYDFSKEEILFLKKAICYDSIHAIERYNHFIYQQKENAYLSCEEKNDLLQDAIRNSKKMCPNYGSYAYMMLANAYVHFAIFSMDNGNNTQALRAMDAARESCKQAMKCLEQSVYSIHNASFGVGLKSSNSLGISSPSEGIIWIDSWREKVLSSSFCPDLKR